MTILKKCHEMKIYDGRGNRNTSDDVQDTRILGVHMSTFGIKVRQLDHKFPDYMND